MQYAAFLLAIYGSICAKQAAITSQNSAKVTVVSGACGCDVQSNQRGEAEEFWLVIHDVDIFLRLQRLQYSALTPRMCFSESSGLINI